MRHSVETVLSVHHWTDSMCSFRTTRNADLSFKNGQFLMIGLMVEGEILWRAYSIVSPNYADYLEFLSIKVDRGAFSSRLRYLNVGDLVYIGVRPTGTLLISNLLDGRNLYLLATGTGLAPFMSIVHDKHLYTSFGKVILVHCVKFVDELVYRDYLSKEFPDDVMLGELVADKLIYYPIVTREEFKTRGRIQHLISSGKLFADLKLPLLDSKEDRIMVCGNPEMVSDVMKMCDSMGFVEGSSAAAGSFVVEKAFVEKNKVDV